jgi:preprotein translocase subunit YajC
MKLMMMVMMMTMMMMMRRRRRRMRTMTKNIKQLHSSDLYQAF